VRFVATVDGRTHTVEVTGEGGWYRLTIGGARGADPGGRAEAPGGRAEAPGGRGPAASGVWEVDARLTAQGIYSLLIAGVSYVADVTDREGACVVDVGGESYVIDVEEETRYIIRTRGGAAVTGVGQTLTAPMPGRVTQVAVRRGDHVEPGRTLIIIEAMKMENELKATTTGTVVEVRVEAGQAVNPGDVLVVVEPA
jgi:biotin carboxyl carrier protein